jgi:hypothetical protein
MSFAAPTETTSPESGLVFFGSTSPLSDCGLSEDILVHLQRYRRKVIGYFRLQGVDRIARGHEYEAELSCSPVGCPDKDITQDLSLAQMSIFGCFSRDKTKIVHCWRYAYTMLHAML